jgi:hypothetical protein
MKTYPMVFLLILVFISCRKEERGSTFVFKSRVFDKITGQPVPNVPVKLLHCRSALLSSRNCDTADVAYTNALGEFRFKILTENLTYDKAADQSRDVRFRALSSAGHASSEEFKIEEGREFDVFVSPLVNKKLVLSYDKQVARVVISVLANPGYSILIADTTLKNSYDLKFSSGTKNYLMVTLVTQYNDIVGYSSTEIDPAVNDTSTIHINL